MICCYSRRFENKMDSKSLYSIMIVLRMAPPPNQKQVPMQLIGWIVMDEGSMGTNCFSKCQLSEDRPCETKI